MPLNVLSSNAYSINTILPKLLTIKGETLWYSSLPRQVVLQVSCVRNSISRGGGQKQGGQSGDETSLEDNHLWKLNVKHKLKIFIWKCLNNALPVNEVVFSRTKKGSPICGNVVKTYKLWSINFAIAEMLREYGIYRR
mgnify:CR=1 FL=1